MAFTIKKIYFYQVEDEDVDVALKLAQVDIYERALREQVRRKRVARDYQLVSQYFKENPLITLGQKLSPMKMARDLKMMRNPHGPKQELIDTLKPFCQFNTCQEFKSLVDTICLEKDLKTRISELKKYRKNGLSKHCHLASFERARFKREIKKRKSSKKAGERNARLLPRPGDYSLKALVNPHYETNPEPVKGVAVATAKKRKGKKSWARKKLKTGRRLLLSLGATLTIPTPDIDDD